jgi:hypothetical protein
MGDHLILANKPLIDRGPRRLQFIGQAFNFRDHLAGV